MKSNKTAVNYLTINLDTFDPAKHELFEETSEAKGSLDRRHDAEAARLTRQVEVSAKDNRQSTRSAIKSSR